MKKTIKALLGSLLLSTAISSNADILLGGDVEANVWYPSSKLNGVSLSDSDNGQAITAEASIEHFIPFVPNVKLGVSKVDQDAIEYTKLDGTLYYEILDNDIVSIDLGLGVSSLNFDVVGTEIDLSGAIPNVYAAVEIGIPTTPVFVYTKGYASAYDDNEVFDVSIGVQYALNFKVLDVEIQSGYRIQKMNMDEFDGYEFEMENSGFFAGINLDF